MKVNEAKEKVCPFIQDAFFAAGDTRGTIEMAQNIKCICSECMAWQFTDECSDIPEVDYETEKGYCKRLSK